MHNYRYNVVSRKTMASKRKIIHRVGKEYVKEMKNTTKMQKKRKM